jgi:hypothetical protein
MGWRAVFNHVEVDKSKWVSAEIRAQVHPNVTSVPPKVYSAPERWRAMAITTILAYGLLIFIW